MPRLSVLEGEEQRTYPLEHQVHLGRGQDNDIVLAGDKMASRYHALVTLGPEGISITDLNSSNGTYVNNYLVTTSSPLKPGDKIIVGDTKLVLLAPMQTLDDLTRETSTSIRYTSAEDTMLIAPGKKKQAAVSKKSSFKLRLSREAMIGLGIAALIALIVISVLVVFLVGKINLV